MELGDLLSTGLGILGGAVGGGGVAGAFFRARQAAHEAQGEASKAEPGKTGEFNRQLLLLFTRIAALESKLEARDAAIDDLQTQVHALQSERDRLREDLGEAQREALGLKAEVAQLRLQVEGVN